MDGVIKEFLAEGMEGMERVDRCVATLEAHPDDSETIGEIFRQVHTLKGSAGFMGFQRLEKLAHAGEHLLSSLRDGGVEASEAVIDGLLKLVDQVRVILRLVEMTGSEGHRATDEDRSVLDLLSALNSPRPANGRAESAPTAAAGAAESGGLVAMNDNTLRIDVEVLNRMMNLVGELVLTRNQILQSHVEMENFPQLARRLDSVTADLRETVMQARMQPLGNLFGKFPRMVRELARACGKVVRVEFSGSETGLDKSLLEAIRDPLTHAVRNCIDHGFEGPAKRIIAGKSPEGLLTMRASHQSGSVIVDVIDDGAGVPVEKVVAKAIERRLVTAEQAAMMSRRELLHLIFLPGFSTSDAITNVSGRGVGMDVIRTNVEKLGGSVEIESTEGVGTHLRMRVPLTLAIVPALVVESGGESFCLPQSALAELVYVPGREAAAVTESVGGTNLFRLRESLLPMFWLDDLLSVCEQEQSRREHGFYLAVLEADNCRFGLVVDELRAPEEIVVKPLSSVLREIGLFSGATVLGNGTLALIIDVAAIAAYAGVRATVEEQAVAVAEAVGIEGGRREAFLVFQERAGVDGKEQTALVLDAVDRIESVEIGEVEFAAGQPLLQYRGGLLPLEDVDGVIAELRQDAKARITVLICHRGGAAADAPDASGGLVGMVVRNVLDVAVGSRVVDSSQLGDGSLAVIGDKVTRLLTGYAAPAGERTGPEGLREVA